MGIPVSPTVRLAALDVDASLRESEFFAASALDALEFLVDAPGAEPYRAAPEKEASELY